MLHSPSGFHNDVVSFSPGRRSARRLRLRGPLAMLLTAGAILASGVVVGQLMPSHAATTTVSQPFAHFPR